jgi:hypothetical protein
MDLSRVSKKNPHEDTRTTLSAIDNRTIGMFNDNYNSLPEKRKLLKKLIRKKNGTRNKYSNEYHDLTKTIDELNIYIYEIQNKTQQIDYLMKAAPHFLDYSNTKMSTQLRKKNEDKDATKDNTVDNTEDNTVDKDNTVDNTEDNTEDKVDEDPTIVNKDIFNGFTITTNEGNNRGKICKDYIRECIGEGYSLSTKSRESESTSELTCKNCGIEKLTNPRESYASCPQCGEMSRYQDTQNNKGEYSEEVEVLSPFAYKRINHFKEWISTLIAREGSGPPQEIIDQLLYELKKDRVETREEVTEERIKGYLKKLKHAKLYDHIPAIIFKLCGTNPPQISRELEAKLIEMFEQIQAPFERFAPIHRKNFLSYSYCLHKMNQLLGQNHLLEKLPLLKSREKLYQQDVVWKQICKSEGWKFIPSL